MLRKIIYFQVFLSSVLSFLIQDFSYNATSSLHGQGTGDATIRDLMTLIVEEKRIRFQLEDRLNAAENEINNMKQYDVAVSNEMEKENKELELLRAQNQMLSDQLVNMTAKNLLLESRIDHLTGDLTNLSSETRREMANLSMNVHNMELQIASFSGNLRNISYMDTLNTSSIGIGFSVYDPVLSTGESSSSTLKFRYKVDNSQDAFNMTTELDESWNDWESWGQCSVTCGYGMERRNRTCSEQTGGKHCYGDSTEYRICYNWLCQDQANQKIDGGWNFWGSWSECSASCNIGMGSRNRSCSNPKPSNGGDYCFGEPVGYRLCNMFACPDQSVPKVEGGWSMWGSWSECSASCGTWMASRNRSCSNPKPSNGGYHCFGDSTEYKLCNRSSCSGVHVGFTVYNGDSSSGTGSNPLKFLSTLYNSDVSFNNSTGVFTCTYPGLYFFSATVMRTSTCCEYSCSFEVNGATTTRVNANDNSNSASYPGSSASIVLRLNKNDRVNLGHCSDGTYMYYPGVSFTGFRISP